MERRLWVQSFCISALHDAVVLCDSTDFLLNFAASSYIWNDTAMDVKFVKIIDHGNFSNDKQSQNWRGHGHLT